jgi:hypothetical protein
MLDIDLYKNPSQLKGTPRKMKFFPTEDITYNTRLKEQEIVKRLSDITEPERTFRFGTFGHSSSKSYEGQVNAQSFAIKRIIRYRNSFLPRINGIIVKDFDGNKIKVKMRLHSLIIVFMFIWCGGVGLACLAFLTQAFSNSKFNAGILIPFGMLTFGYVLTMAAFKYESNKSKKDLQLIFEAELIEE